MTWTAKPIPVDEKQPLDDDEEIPLDELIKFLDAPLPEPVRPPVDQSSP